MTAFMKRRLGLSTPLTLSQREAIQGLIYISPWIFGFLIFTVGPMIASGYLSLTDYNIVTEPRFAGFSNYEYMVKDRLFWKSVENTLYYTVIFVPISIVCSLGLAMLLKQNIRGRIALRTLYFLPSVTPVVATAFLWVWIFQPQIGLANTLISHLGLGNGPGWLTHPGSSKPALIFMSLRGAVGGNTLWIFLRIIVPLSKPVIITMVLIAFLDTWNDFFGPLIYLNTPEKYTLSLGLANFQRVVSAGGQATEHLLMAASMVMTLPSVLVFILLQRYYIQGVVISSGSK